MTLLESQAGELKFDSDNQKWAERLLAGENRLLEMIAKGNSLAVILDALCRLVEELSSGSLSAILLLDPDGNRLWHGAAPSLPKSYTEAIDGGGIGPAAGSCGTAAYRGEPVAVSDIATDPLWAEYRDLALSHGLRACWSTPIHSSERKVLRTFAIYAREPGKPTPQHHKIIEQITYLAAVAIERNRTQAALLESEERFRRMADAIPEVIWFTALEPENVLYVSSSFERIWGLPIADLYRNPRLWTETIHPDDRDRVTNTFARWIVGEEVSDHDIEFRIVQPSGAIRWIHERGVLSLNDQGKPYLASGISTDITERKEAEDALRRSESYLAEAQRVSRTGSFGWNVSSGEIFWSEETYRIAGYDPEIKPTLDLVFQGIDPGDRARVRETLDRAVCGATDLDVEHRFLRPDGTVKYVHVLARAVRNQSGSLEYVGAAMDVTEQREARGALEAALGKIQKSEDQLRAIIDTIPAMVTTTLADGSADFLNKYWQEYTGLPLQAGLGLGWTAAIHPDDRAAMVEAWHASITTGTLFQHEGRVRRADGAYRWFLHRALPLRDDLGRIVRWYAACHDIDDQKQAEDRVRQDERELRQLIDVVPQHIFVLRPDGSRLHSNQVAREYHGLTAEDPQGDHLAMFVHPDDLESVLAERQRLIAHGAAYEMEVRLRGKDGQYRWFLIRGNPLRDEQGRIIRWYGTRTDIEDRKRAEEKLRQDERELRRITEAIPQAISVLAPDGTILHANKVVLDYTGLSLEDVKTDDFRTRLFHPDDRERLRDQRQQALSRGEPFEAELRARRKDGQYRWFLVRYNPLRDDEGRIIRWYATGIDIEDRKQAEERIQKENLALREEIDHSSMFEEIVGSSEALRRVLVQVAKVAPVDSTVLILGETGTGKELIARAIHKRSNRSSRAFIRVNCAAIPPSLIASELFGHEKGAFTGALQRRLGRFELADGGTIFLDEIGELPAETQTALLRVLQEQEFERVGSSQPISVDVRVIAATNRDLKAAVAAGTFRQDLFYRLNVFPIQMPSLRERMDDIHLLVEYFIERYGKTAGKKFRNINKKTVELFQAYDWPGNVRELQNVIERAVILCDGDTFSIDETWLKRESPQASGPTVSFVATLVEREKEIIETALAACRGRIAGPLGAASKLGIPRQTLESKIKSLGIDKQRFKARPA
jgi:formate hydrogenlyase transcriptional activator